MTWSIKYTTASRRVLKKLDPSVTRQILETMRQVVEGDPYDRGKALTGNWAGHWRYRSGNYRIICRLYNKTMVIEVVKAGHRSSVYDRP